MQSILTIQSRGYTTRTGYSGIDDVLDRCAVLYNAALQHRRDAWKQAQDSVSCYDQFREVTGLRQDDPLLGSPLCPGSTRGDHACPESLQRLLSQGAPRRDARLSALQAALSVQDPGNTGGVQFDAEGSGQRFTGENQGLPTIHIYPSRELPPLEQARSLQITRRNRAIDVNIQFAFTPEALQPTGRITALDPGVARRLTGSDGFLSNPIKRDRARVTTLQKWISTFRERALVDGRARWEPVMTRWGTPGLHLTRKATLHA